MRRALAKRGRRRWAWVVPALALEGAFALVACGSRTGFPEDDYTFQDVEPHDATPLPPRPDVFPLPPPRFTDALPPGFDAPFPVFDASVDAIGFFDQTAPDDGAFDTTIPDATLDTRPDTDLPDTNLPDVLPLIDANPLPDVVRNDCPDAAATLVYVITSQAVLYSFYPPTLTFTRIGSVVCPSTSQPYSMAVDRKGKAYVVYQDGNLFRLSTATAACIGTPFAPNQQGFTTFGMGFASDTNGPAETLYVARNTGGTSVLATIDIATFLLNPVGPFVPTIQRTELTGTGDGRLFGFFTNPVGTGSRIVEVDKTTAQVLAANDLPVGTPLDAWAFAYWGGEFWVFTSPGGASNVTRFRPSDMTTATLATMPETIVGAGVSTCAPQ